MSNYLINPSFQQGETNWTNPYQSYIIIIPKGGEKTGFFQDVSKTKINFEAFDKFKFSIDIRGEKSDQNGRIAIWELGNGETNSSHSFKIDDNWTKISEEYQIKRDNSSAIRVEVYLDTLGCEYFLRDAKLERC